MTKTTLWQTHSAANVYEGRNLEASDHLFCSVLQLMIIKSCNLFGVEIAKLFKALSILTSYTNVNNCE